MFEYKINFRKTYIEVISEGDKDKQASAQLWKEVIKACEKHQCFKVLGISHSNNAFSSQETYDIVDHMRSLGIDGRFKIAWTESNPEALQKFNMIESIIHSKMKLPSFIFSNVEEALSWLLSED